MKKLLTTAFAVCLSQLSLQAQAPVPCAYSFELPAPPIGWTEFLSVTNGTTRYTGGSDASACCKLDGTAEYVQVQLADEAGPITYFLQGKVAAGVTTWLGTFTVEQSVNGSTWTPLHTFTGNLSTSAFGSYTDTPNPASRYIRFYFTNKTSGNNVALDQINVARPIPTPAQEINASINSTNYPVGATYYTQTPISTPQTINVLVSNLGTSTPLVINSANLLTSGPGFTIAGAVPTTIAANSSATIAVTFNPSAAGTYTNQLIINSNDANEGVYAINLYGIGGNAATEPSGNISSTLLTFPESKSYKTKVRVTCIIGEKFLVVKSIGAPGIPQDGSQYLIGDAPGGGQGKVCFIGTSGTNAQEFYPTDVRANTPYTYTVYAYNGFGAYKNYTATGYDNMVTSSGGQPGTYYNGLNPSASTFVTDLHAKINPHTSIFYSNYKALIVKDFEARDTTAGQRVITCAESGENVIYTEPFDWTATNMSREHVFAHSWMPNYPANTGSEKPNYNDFYNLFPANFSDVNQIRGNKSYGEIIGTPAYTYKGCKIGFDANGTSVFEPLESSKGDLARAIFYMCVAYNGVDGLAWTMPTVQQQDVLRKWHFQDLPSNYEIARNDYIYEVQGNRNPFIDYPDWLCSIDFRTMNHINLSSPCAVTAINEQGNIKSYALYPNPATNVLYLNYYLQRNTNTSLYLTDVTGKQVLTTTSQDAAGLQEKQINIANLSAGIYTLTIQVDGSVVHQRVVIQ